MNPIVQTVRSYVGTPYRHQGRIPGVALDCIGVGICAAWDLGLKPRSFDITGYRRLPDGHSLTVHLDNHMDRIESLEVGALVVVTEGILPHHVGIVGDHPLGGYSLIHASNRRKRVEETRLVFNEAVSLVSIYRFRGI